MNSFDHFHTQIFHWISLTEVLQTRHSLTQIGSTQICASPCLHDTEIPPHTTIEKDIDGSDDPIRSAVSFWAKLIMGSSPTDRCVKSYGQNRLCWKSCWKYFQLEIFPTTGLACCITGSSWAGAGAGGDKIRAPSARHGGSDCVWRSLFIVFLSFWPLIIYYKLIMYTKTCQTVKATPGSLLLRRFFALSIFLSSSLASLARNKHRLFDNALASVTFHQHHDATRVSCYHTKQ